MICLYIALPLILFYNSTTQTQERHNRECVFLCVCVCGAGVKGSNAGCFCSTAAQRVASQQIYCEPVHNDRVHRQYQCSFVWDIYTMRLHLFFESKPNLKSIRMRCLVIINWTQCACVQKNCHLSQWTFLSWCSSSRISWQSTCLAGVGDSASRNGSSLKRGLSYTHGYQAHLDVTYLLLMLDPMFQIPGHPQQPLDLLRAEVFQGEAAAALQIHWTTGSSSEAW